MADLRDRRTANGSRPARAKRMSLGRFSAIYGIHKPTDWPHTLALNGRQIIQAVLTDAGMDFKLFKNSNKQMTVLPKSRCTKKCSHSGTTLPSPTPLKHLQDKKKKSCMRKEFSAGHFLLYPGRLKKLFLIE